MLFLIKSVHSLIFFVVSAAIFYVWYAIFTDTQNTLLWLSVATIILETVIYLGNGVRCPLTNLAKKYGDETGNDLILDIFLPVWFIPLIPRICGTLAVVGLLTLFAQLLT